MKALFITSIVTLAIVVIVCTNAVLWAIAPTNAHSILHTNTITIGWVGDIVPSDDTAYSNTAFINVQSKLQEPDLMMGNLEGTFATTDRISKCAPFDTTCYAFRGDPSFADAIKRAGFDFVSIVNNHSYDFGDDGLKDTETTLEKVSIPYISPTSPTASIVVKGKHIGILGISNIDPVNTLTDYTFIQKTVTMLRAHNDFVIVIFHGGAEGADKTQVPGTEEFQGSEDRGNVELLAHTAIDAGADLVLGSGPHVLRKIEQYKNGVIAYSLGNFVGSKQLSTVGTLALSGIFTATLQSSRPAPYTFTSVILSRDGVPSIDLFGQGSALLETLSK